MLVNEPRVSEDIKDMISTEELPTIDKDGALRRSSSSI